MDKEQEIDVVDLAIASEETHGSDLDVIEGSGKRQVFSGISDD